MSTSNFWWIDTFTIYPGRYYRFHVVGENTLQAEPGMRWFSWAVPTLRGGGGRYAFRLRAVN